MPQDPMTAARPAGTGTPEAAEPIVEACAQGSCTPSSAAGDLASAAASAEPRATRPSVLELFCRTGRLAAACLSEGLSAVAVGRSMAKAAREAPVRQLDLTLPCDQQEVRRLAAARHLACLFASPPCSRASGLLRSPAPDRRRRRSAAPRPAPEARDRAASVAPALGRFAFQLTGKIKTSEHLHEKWAVLQKSLPAYKNHGPALCKHFAVLRNMSDAGEERIRALDAAVTDLEKYSRAMPEGSLIHLHNLLLTKITDETDIVVKGATSIDGAYYQKFHCVLQAASRALPEAFQLDECIEQVAEKIRSFSNVGKINVLVKSLDEVINTTDGNVDSAAVDCLACRN